MLQHQTIMVSFAPCNLALGESIHCGLGIDAMLALESVLNVQLTLPHLELLESVGSIRFTKLQEVCCQVMMVGRILSKKKNYAKNTE